MNADFENLEGQPHDTAKPGPWLGKLHAVNDETQVSSVYAVGFWATGRDECEALLENAEKPEDARSIWLEDLLPAVEHSKRGMLDPALVQLARSVSPHTPILFELQTQQAQPSPEPKPEPETDDLREVWEDFLTAYPSVWMAFATMDAPALAQDLIRRGKNEYALGVVLGAKLPTVMLLRARDLPDLAERLADPKDDLAPLFFLPDATDVVDYDLFVAPALSHLTPFGPTPQLSEDKAHLLKEANAELMQFFPPDRPLLYTRDGLAAIREVLIPLPPKARERKDLSHIVIMQGDDGLPELFMLPEKPLADLVCDDVYAGREAKVAQAQLQRLVRHALFEATPQGADPIAFIAEHEAHVLAVAGETRHEAQPVPYYYFVTYMLPTIITAQAEGFDLRSVPQIGQLFGNRELMLMQKVAMFPGVLNRLRKMAQASPAAQEEEKI